MWREAYDNNSCIWLFGPEEENLHLLNLLGVMLLGNGTYLSINMSSINVIRRVLRVIFRTNLTNQLMRLVSWCFSEHSYQECSAGRYLI